MNLPKIKPVLYKNKTYKDGTHPIMIRITRDRKASYVSVGYSVSENAWDADQNIVFERKPQISKRQEGQLNSEKLVELKLRYKDAIVLPNCTVINAAIQDAVVTIAKTAHELKNNEESLESKSVKTKLKNENKLDKKKSFLAFADDYQNSFLKANSLGTYRRYGSLIKKLRFYLKDKDLSYNSITPGFLEDYQSHLYSLGNKVNTVHNNLKSIRAIYYAAIAQQIITAEKNPFFVFKLKSENSVRKEKLTIDEIKAIERLEFADDSLLQHCQKFFLCSFYCAGVRASDMLLLKWKNVLKNDRVEYRMEKTGTFKSIMLIPKAKAIFDSYKGKSKPEDFVFPFMKDVDQSDIKAVFNRISSSTAVINKYLKKIAKDAEIEKVLSTHIARHSFSDIARKKKASIYDISKMLGHSSIKITEAYLASLDIDSQDETMSKILDF